MSASATASGCVAANGQKAERSAPPPSSSRTSVFGPYAGTTAIVPASAPPASAAAARIAPPTSLPFTWQTLRSGC